MDNELNPHGDFVVVKRRLGLRQKYRWTRYSSNHKKISGSQEQYTDLEHTIEMAIRCNVGCAIRDSEGYNLNP